jgi:hypothetical protein
MTNLRSKTMAGHVGGGWGWWLKYTEKTEQKCVICLLTAVGLTPGGSSILHIYAQTIHFPNYVSKNLRFTGESP